MNKSKGFTLIELVISIFILSVAIIGVANAFYVITILTSDSTNKITAAYLAQEGMEIVRNIRDINWLNMDRDCKINNCASGNTWLNNNLDSPTCSSTGCEADYKSLSVSLSSGRYLNINADGFYSYDIGTQTKFKRKIIITNITDTDNVESPNHHIIKVKTEVSWDVKSTILDISGFTAGNCVEGKNCIIVQETLYNWYFPKH